MRVKTTRTDLYVKMAKEGLAIADIAHECGVSRQAVHSALRIAKSKGIYVDYNKKLVPIDEDAKNTILELYNQYKSLDDIANATGVCNVTITKTVKEAREKGLVNRPAKSRSDIYQRIINMINEGYRAQAISDAIGLPVNQVYNYIAKAKKENKLINYDPMVTTRKWDTVYDKAVDLYNNGSTHKEITDELHICECTLFKILSKAEKNLDIVFRQKDNSKYYKFVELYNKGYSRRSIAKELKIAPSTVSDYLCKAKKDNRNLLTRDNFKYHQDVIDKVIDLYNKGYKYREIGSELNLKDHAVNYIISETRLRYPETITRPKKSRH